MIWWVECKRMYIYMYMDVYRTFWLMPFILIWFITFSGIDKVGGLTYRSWTSYSVNNWASECTVRPCFKSPTIVMVNLFTVPISWRMVNISSNACVGCSPIPSPALIIGLRQCWLACYCRFVMFVIHIQRINDKKKQKDRNENEID